MAEIYYSEHYGPSSTATVAPPTSLPVAAAFAPSGKSAATVRHARERLDFAALGSNPTLATADTWRIFTLESGDRIHDLRVSAATWTGSTIVYDLGIYLSGSSHDGPAVDDDLFASAFDFTGGLTRDEMFSEATTLLDVDRSKTLWELLGLSEDPRVSYDVVATLTVTTLVSSAPILFECDYTAAAKN